MAVNWNKVKAPSVGATILLPDVPAGRVTSSSRQANAWHVVRGPAVSEVFWVNALSGNTVWNHELTLYRPSARALALLLLLETAGPLERLEILRQIEAEGFTLA